jgi:hypothetical protein
MAASRKSPAIENTERTFRIRSLQSQGNLLEGVPMKDGTGPLELTLTREALEGTCFHARQEVHVPWAEARTRLIEPLANDPASDPPMDQLDRRDMNAPRKMFNSDLSPMIRWRPAAIRNHSYQSLYIVKIFVNRFVNDR